MTARVATILLGLGSVAIPLFISGCGGGGSEDTTTAAPTTPAPTTPAPETTSSVVSACHNAQFPAVSQSIKGNMDLNVSLAALPVPLSFVVDIENLAADLDTLNVWMGAELKSGVFTVGEMGLSMKFNNQTATIFLGMMGQKNCTTLTWPPLAIEASLIKQIIVMMLPCMGRENGLDEFGLSLGHSAAMPNSSLEIKFGMYDDGLMQSMAVDVDVQMPNMAGGVAMAMSPESTMGGPSDDEMGIPEAWGECLERHIGPDEIAELMSSPQDFFVAFLGQVADLQKETSVVA